MRGSFPTPILDTRWHFLSHRGVVLENKMLRVGVLPELGGRVWSIVYKPLGRELLWHNPEIPPRKATFGAVFDDVWCGGWEEMFPTAAAGIINGQSYPDHGEVWSLAWEATTESSEDAASVRLACHAPISGIRMEKKLTLQANEPRLDVSYLLRNPTGSDFPFTLALHPALAVSPNCRVDFPSMLVDPDASYLGTLAGVESPFEWPYVTQGSRKVDLRIVPPVSSGEVYFLYGHRFQEGWCAITDTTNHLTYGLVFSPEVFRSCWLFATYGGWRDYCVAILEPSTSYPQQIEQAIQQGTAPSLRAGGTLETTVVFQVQEGLSRVVGLTPDGKFHQ